MQQTVIDGIFSRDNDRTETVTNGISLLPNSISNFILMNKPPLFSMLLFLLFTLSISAQEELASASMVLKKTGSNNILPITDYKKNIHIFGISEGFSDEGILHIIHNAETNALMHSSYDKPEAIATKKAVGIAIDPSNTVSLYFHKKGKGEFHRVAVNENGKLTYDSFDLKLKKERVVQYISENNEFFVMTVNRSQSILNIYQFTGSSHEKITYDLTGERFYSKDSKIVPLPKLLIEQDIAVICNELSSNAKDYGKRIKIYPKKEVITFTINSNDNGTRIVHLSRKDNTVKAGYVPMPTEEFVEGREISIRTNSFLHDDTLYSLIMSNKLLVIDIKNMSDKEVLKVFRFSPDDEISFKSTQTSVLPIGPITLYNTKTKEKTKSAKAFFRDLKNEWYSGLHVNKSDAITVLKVGGYSPPSDVNALSTGFGPGAVSAGEDAFSNVSIVSSGPISYRGNLYNYYSLGVEKKLVVDATNYELLTEDTYNDVYDTIGKLTADMKSVQHEALLKIEDYYVFGYYDKENERYSLLKLTP